MVIRAEYLNSDGSLAIEKAAEICLQCGVCCVLKGHSCHAQFSERFDPKHTYVYDCLGAEEPTENPNIWFCVSCHKCEELCPYEVSPVHYIEALKTVAFINGKAHESVIGEIRQILGTGYAFPFTRASTRQRETLGLEALSERAVKDLALIAEKTGLTTRLEEGEG